MNSLKKTIGVICLTIFAFTTSAQVSKEHAFQAMDNLIGGEWHLKAQFSAKSAMEQDIKVTKILNGSTYLVETSGNIASTGHRYGLRNQGMRGWSKEFSKMEFVEADVFGGFVTGEVAIEGMDILYHYVYAGQNMTEAWIYKGPNIYEFIVGVRNDRGQWIEMELNGQVSRKK